MRRWLVLVLGLAACRHPDIPTFGEDIHLPPIDPDGWQVTFGAIAAPNWSLDGQHLTYLYTQRSTSVGIMDTISLQCVGLAARAGGTRTWSYCDTRSTRRDSVDRYTMPAVRPNGQMLFMQAAFRRPSGATTPVTDLRGAAIWLVDTADALARRRQLTALPRLIGDSVISWMDNAGWIDDDTFLFNGARFGIGGDGSFTPQPRMIIRGRVTPDAASFTAIPGTEGAISWTRLGNGDLAFLRGAWWTIFWPGQQQAVFALLSDSLVWRVPADGGTPVPVAHAPRRLTSLTCAGTSCLANDFDVACPGGNPANCQVDHGSHTITCTAACPPTTNQFLQVNVTTGQVTSRTATDGLRLNPRLNATGTEYAYLFQARLFRAPIALP